MGVTVMLGLGVRAGEGSGEGMEGVVEEELLLELDVRTVGNVRRAGVGRDIVAVPTHWLEVPVTESVEEPKDEEVSISDAAMCLAGNR